MSGQDPSIAKVDAALRRLHASLASFNIRDEKSSTAAIRDSPEDSSDDELSTDDDFDRPRMFSPRMDLTSKELYPDVCSLSLSLSYQNMYANKGLDHQRRTSY